MQCRVTLRQTFLRKALFALRQGAEAVARSKDRVKNSVRAAGACRARIAEALGLERGRVFSAACSGSSTTLRTWGAAYFVSPFEEAAVCAIDGFGDFVSTSLADRQGVPTWSSLEKVYFPHSLGLLYLAITQYLGFNELRGRVQSDGARALRPARICRTRSAALCA